MAGAPPGKCPLRGGMDRTVGLNGTTVFPRAWVKFQQIRWYEEDSGPKPRKGEGGLRAGGTSA